MSKFNIFDEINDCKSINTFYHNKVLNNEGKYMNNKEFINIYKLTEKKNNLEYQLYRCNYKDKNRAKLLLCYAQFSNFMENLHCVDEEISKNLYLKKKNQIELEINKLKNVLDECKRL